MRTNSLKSPSRDGVQCRGKLSPAGRDCSSLRNPLSRGREQATSSSRRWFEHTFGFEEGPFSWTKGRFEFADGDLVCKPSGQRFHVGPWELLSLHELTERLEVEEELVEGSTIRNDTTGSRGRIIRVETEEFLMQTDKGAEEWLEKRKAARVRKRTEPLTFKNIACDTQALHQDSQTAGAVIQVASLSNCLEMSGPEVPPQDGITGYCQESSQGAICSMACPAGAIYRNYFLNSPSQVDCLSGVAELVRNKEEGFWNVRNGYCVPNVAAKVAVLSKLVEQKTIDLEDLRGRVKVGILWDTEVNGCSHRVCQVRCSAIPVSLVKPPKPSDWGPFACEVLEASYRATLAVAAGLAMSRGERVRVFLTTLGCGIMGNRTRWIARGLHNALEAFASAPLDVSLVHVGEPPAPFLELQEHHPVPADYVPYVPPQGRSIRSLTDRMGVMTDELNMLDQQVTVRDKCPTGNKIAQAFAYFDINGDGIIDRAEFVDILQTLDSALFTEDFANKLLAEADSDGDGFVHYLEFSAWLSGEDSLINSRVLSATRQEVESEGDLDAEIRRELSIRSNASRRRG